MNTRAARSNIAHSFACVLLTKPIVDRQFSYLLPVKPGVGRHRLDSHCRYQLAPGIRFRGLEVKPHPKSKAFAPIGKALEVGVEIGNVHELVPGRVEIPASPRHHGLRRAELSAVAGRRLHQPIDRIDAGEGLDLSFLTAYQESRDAQLKSAFHHADVVFHGRFFRSFLVEAKALEQQRGAQGDDANDDDQLDQGKSGAAAPAPARPGTRNGASNGCRSQAPPAPYPTSGGRPPAPAPIRRASRSGWARSARRASSARIRLRADTFLPLRAAARPARPLPHRPRSSAAPRE